MKKLNAVCGKLAKDFSFTIFFVIIMINVNFFFHVFDSSM